MNEDADNLEIEEAVIADIKRRRALGRMKYNRTMERDDLTPSQWAQHLFEELLDSAIYARRLMRDLAKAEKHRCSHPDVPGGFSAGELVIPLTATDSVEC